MEENANQCGYPSLVVAEDSTGSPFAFSFSWLDQLGKVHWTEEEQGIVSLDYSSYKPSGLFEECLESLEKQKKESAANSNVITYNGRQGSLFNTGLYQRVSTYKPATNEWADDYDDSIEDKKYQKLLKRFRKADTKFNDSHIYQDPKYEVKRQIAVDTEAKLDAYCRQKGYNQEMGWM